MDRVWCMVCCFKYGFNCSTASLADSLTLVAACLALLHMTLRHLLTCTALNASGREQQPRATALCLGAWRAACSAMRPSHRSAFTQEEPAGSQAEHGLLTDL